MKDIYKLILFIRRNSMNYSCTWERSWFLARVSKYFLGNHSFNFSWYFNSMLWKNLPENLYFICRFDDHKFLHLIGNWNMRKK